MLRPGREGMLVPLELDELDEAPFGVALAALFRCCPEFEMVPPLCLLVPLNFFDRGLSAIAPPTFANFMSIVSVISKASWVGA
jgi:hypothetical protein